MRRTDRDLVTVAALAIVSGLALAQPGLPVLFTALAGSALVLLLPGYALSRALFARPRLDHAERTILVLGLSISLTIMGGFLLNVLRPGLTAGSWGVLLATLTVAFAVVARLRGAKVETVETAPAAPLRIRSIVPQAQLIMLGAAAVLVFAALGLARAGVAMQPAQPFTQLWMFGEPAGTSVRIGLTNHEGHDVAYRLVIAADGQTVRELPSIAVAGEGTWEQVVTLPPAGTILRTIEATLYRPGDTAPYREVHVSIRALPPGAPTPADPAAPAATPEAVPTPVRSLVAP